MNNRIIILIGLCMLLLTSIVAAKAYTIDYNDWLTRAVGDYVYCLADGTNCVLGGSGAGDKWVDNGSYIQPNDTFSNNVFVSGYMNATTLCVNASCIDDWALVNGTGSGTGGNATFNATLVLWENLTGTVNMKTPQHVDFGRQNISNIDSIFQNGYRLTNLSTNDFIHRDIFAIMMNGSTGVELPHFYVQQAGAGQFSGLVRTWGVINENESFLNNTNRTDCIEYFDFIGEELKIDCNTSTTGADFFVGDDVQIIDELWLKDTDGEWHFMTRELELLDELRDETVISRINNTILGNNLTIIEAEGRTIVVNLAENTTILPIRNDSILLIEGTNASPNFIHVYYNGAGNPTLFQSLTPQEEKADVAQILYGGNYSYGDIIGSATGYEFIHGVYHRFFDEGAIYISGFEQNITALDVNISSGTMKVMLTQTDILAGHSTDNLSIHQHSDGTYHQHTDLDGFDAYSSGEAISNNKYFNVVYGIVHTTDGEGRLFGIVQNKPITEYVTLISAETDTANTVLNFPSNTLLKKLFVPVARVVMQRTGGSTNTIQTLTNEAMFFDLRGTVTAAGGSSPVGSITSHPDLTNLAWSVAGHTIDSDVDMVGNSIINGNYVNTTILNVTTNATINYLQIMNSIQSSDWTNVTITESQISDLVHTINCTATDSCNSIVYGTNTTWITDNVVQDNTTFNQTLTDESYANASLTDTNASTACSGTTTYLDGENNCDDISLVYAPISTVSDNESFNSSLVYWTRLGTTLYPKANNDTLTSIGGLSVGGLNTIDITGRSFIQNNLGHQFTTTGRSIGLDIGAYHNPSGSKTADSEGIAGFNVAGTSNYAGAASMIGLNFGNIALHAAFGGLGSAGSSALDSCGIITYGGKGIGFGAETVFTVDNIEGGNFQSAGSNVAINGDATTLTLLVSDSSVAGDEKVINLEKPTQGTGLNAQVWLQGTGFGTGINFNDLDTRISSTASHIFNVSGDLIPGINITYDLGSATHAWDNIYYKTAFDMTPAYSVSRDGNITETISNIKNLPNGEIDHLSYPEFARGKHYTLDVTRTECLEYPRIIGYNITYDGINYYFINMTQSLTKQEKEFYVNLESIYGQPDMGVVKETKIICTNRSEQKSVLVDENLTIQQQKNYVVNELQDYQVTLNDVNNAEIVYTRKTNAALTMSIENQKDLIQRINDLESRIKALEK